MILPRARSGSVSNPHKRNRLYSQPMRLYRRFFPAALLPCLTHAKDNNCLSAGYAVE